MPLKMVSAEWQTFSPVINLLLTSPAANFQQFQLKSLVIRHQNANAGDIKTQVWFWIPSDIWR